MAPVRVSGGARSQKRPQIDDAEDDDPHRVDEVPVEAHRLPRHRAHGPGAAEIRREERRERHKAGKDVNAMKSAPPAKARSADIAERAAINSYPSLRGAFGPTAGGGR